jgi:hypothetical protein
MASRNWFMGVTQTFKDTDKDLAAAGLMTSFFEPSLKGVEDLGQRLDIAGDCCNICGRVENAVYEIIEHHGTCDGKCHCASRPAIMDNGSILTSFSR